jgi:hypothetical protein
MLILIRSLKQRLIFKVRISWITLKVKVLLTTIFFLETIVHLEVIRYLTNVA